MNKLMHILGKSTADMAKGLGIKSANKCWYGFKQPKFPKELDRYRKR